MGTDSGNLATCGWSGWFGFGPECLHTIQVGLNQVQSHFGPGCLHSLIVVLRSQKKMWLFIVGGDIQ